MNKESIEEELAQILTEEIEKACIEEHGVNTKELQHKLYLSLRDRLIVGHCDKCGKDLLKAFPHECSE